jgi:hypothetical protein
VVDALLQGRAEVEMVLTKAEPGEKFDIKGKLYDNVKVRMVIDGYNAPITGDKPAASTLLWTPLLLQAIPALATG